METIVNVFDNQDSLEHYGVKGMRWGVRRTPVQLGHKSSTSDLDDKAKQLQTVTKAASKAKKRAEKAEKRVLRRSERAAIKSEKAAKMAAARETKRREEILNSPTKLYKHRKEFDEKTINDAIRRFQWERTLRDLSKNEMSIGKMYLDTAIGYAESGMKAYNTAAKIYNTINKVQGTGKSLPTIDGGQQAKKKDKKKDDDDD